MLLEPFLLRHATARTDAIPFDGAYCQDLQMWVISAGADMIPVIDCQVEAHIAVSKTHAQREQDDEPFLSPILDLQTKTEAQLESEDHKSPILLASLVTKTDTTRESDDERSILV